MVVMVPQAMPYGGYGATGHAIATVGSYSRMGVASQPVVVVSCRQAYLTHSLLHSAVERVYGVYG